MQICSRFPSKSPLLRHKRFANLDSDVGLSEFTPPRCLSLTILDRETIEREQSQVPGFVFLFTMLQITMIKLGTSNPEEAARWIHSLQDIVMEPGTNSKRKLLPYRYCFVKRSKPQRLDFWPVFVQLLSLNQVRGFKKATTFDTTDNGMTPHMNASAALLAFVFMRNWANMLQKSGISSVSFARHENTTNQTCSVDCYSICHWRWIWVLFTEVKQENI